jgi:TPR repeat protein
LSIQTPEELKKAQEAWSTCELAIKQSPGDSQLQFLLGKTSSTLRAYSQSASWYRAAAERGHAKAMSALGYQYMLGLGVKKDATEAVRWWRRAAARGNADAMTNLGAAYAQGEGVAQDFAQALKLWLAASKRGDALAMVNLATLYLNGTGVEKNLAEARKWLARAEEVQPGILEGLEGDNGLPRTHAAPQRT